MRIDRILALGIATSALLVTTGVLAQQKEIKIGLIFDQTGPFAGVGRSRPSSARNTQLISPTSAAASKAIRLIRSSPTLSQEPTLP